MKLVKSKMKNKQLMAAVLLSCMAVGNVCGAADIFSKDGETVIDC